MTYLPAAYYYPHYPAYYSGYGSYGVTPFQTASTFVEAQKPSPPAKVRKGPYPQSHDEFHHVTQCPSLTMKNTAYIPRKQNVELPPPKNPFVNGIFRYAGYLNELGEAFVHPMHAAFTAINPKWTGMAHKVVDATYKAVFAYTCMDAAYSGAQAYFRARQDGNSEKMAAMKGLQAGVGQGIFQLLASYYVPAEIIKRVFNPMGTKLGMMLGKTKTMGTVGGTALSLLAIPLMVKVVDPLSEKLVHALWTKPTNRFLERRDQGEVARSFHAPHKANAAVL